MREREQKIEISFAIWNERLNICCKAKGVCVPFQGENLFQFFDATVR